MLTRKLLNRKHRFSLLDDDDNIGGFSVELAIFEKVLTRETLKLLEIYQELSTLN